MKFKQEFIEAYVSLPLATSLEHYEDKTNMFKSFYIQCYKRL